MLDDNWLADEHLGKLSGDDGDVVRGRRVIRGRWRCSFPEQESYIYLNKQEDKSQQQGQLKILTEGRHTYAEDAAGTQ